MAITPSVLIAAQGFMTGQGLGVSSAMTSQFSKFASSPTTGALTNIGSLYPSGTSGLPAFMTDSQSQISAITAQASSIIQPGVAGLKKFTSIMNQSAGFGAAAAEWGGALKEFSGKGFSDLGINVNSFSGIATNGMGSVFGGLPPLPSMSSLPGASALTSLTLAAKDNMAALGKSLGGLGSMFDPSEPTKMGDPASLIRNLQNQGLGDVGGINDMIQQAGYSPGNLDAIPPAQLRRILGNVQGTDLAKIIGQTGLKVPLNTQLTSLNDVLDAQKILPAGVITTLPGGSLAGLGNALGNLGGSIPSFSDVGNMLSKVEVPSLPNLDGLKKLVPDDVMASFSGMLGTGDSPLGLPTMSDMLGSVSGKAHMDSFANISKSMNSIAESPVGRNMIQASQGLSTATSAAQAAGQSMGEGLGLTGSALTEYIAEYVASDADVISAKVEVDTSVSAFNTAAAGNAELKALVDKSNGALASTSAQLTKEQNNLSLAGLGDLSGVTAPNGSGSLLSMASKLHGFGVDKQQLGFAEMFEGMADDSLYGDAIKSSLLEGRNLARQTKLSVPVPTKADPSKTLASAIPNVDPDAVEWDSTDATEVQSALSKLTGMNNQIISWLDANPNATQDQNDQVNAKLDGIMSKTLTVKQDIAKLS